MRLTVMIRDQDGALAAELQKIPPGILPNSPALAQYRQAVRIQAEADAGQPPAGQTDWAAQPGVMAAKVAGWAAPEGSGSHD